MFYCQVQVFLLLLLLSKRGKGGEEITKKEREAEKMCFRKRARNTIARTKKRLSKRTFSRRSRYPNSHFDSYPISRLVNPRRVAVASRTFFYRRGGDEKILVRKRSTEIFSSSPRGRPSLSLSLLKAKDRNGNALENSNLSVS